jgi:hypothetical protein
VFNGLESTNKLNSMRWEANQSCDLIGVTAGTWAHRWQVASDPQTFSPVEFPSRELKIGETGHIGPGEMAGLSLVRTTWNLRLKTCLNNFTSRTLF